MKNKAFEDMKMKNNIQSKLDELEKENEQACMDQVNLILQMAKEAQLGDPGRISTVVIYCHDGAMKLYNANLDHLFALSGRLDFIARANLTDRLEQGKREATQMETPRVKVPEIIKPS